MKRNNALESTQTSNVAQLAADRWNAGADEYNQWEELGQDEKDELISAERKLLASPDMDASISINPE